ncbi:DNA polymerase subunit cdc27 domain-containing protein [Sarocladium implicatum]|nr:DNA polymerase subunit cdc27 domain-containing protein [Sarocladium implicatum]
MEEHRKYLADRLLSDEQPITYRLLSRALDVHVNTAKEMLYDFLHYQNGIKENSIHATYLLYGQKKSQTTHPDGDIEMGSSQPEQEPISDPVTTDTLTLVAEESLKAIMAEYEKVTSINVYSLAPHPQKDLSLLSEFSKSVAEYAAKEDPLEAARKYGTITNPGVRRRDRSGQAKPAPISAPKAVKTEAPAPKAPVKTEPTPAAATKPTQAAKIKQEAAETSSKDSTPTSSAGKPSSSSKPALKRGGSGGIMQSFAKAANKPAKPKPAPKKEEEDTSMALSDDGEADEEDLPAAKKKQAEQEAESLRKSKKEREAELRKMMEEDDEEEEKDEEDEEQQDEEMDDAPEPEPEPVEEKKEAETPAEVVASSGDGRRRGKRRVTKKKRILDDQGYMVTINEEGWESFSEEDKPPPAKKQTPNPTPASSGAKAKKPAGKPGQGNIMSFFGKK